MLIQFKRRKHSGTIAEYSINEGDIGFFPKTLEECAHGSAANNYRLYIGMIMELGVQTEPLDIAKTPKIFRPNERSSVNKITDPRPRPLPATGEVLAQAMPSKIYIPQYGTKHHPFVGHARYHIFAYGCSPTVYQSIDTAHKVSYAFLLSSRDFLGEHPHSDVRSLAALRRMKPFWTGSDDCYQPITGFSMTMCSMGLLHPRGKASELEKDHLMMRNIAKCFIVLTLPRQETGQP